MITYTMPLDMTPGEYPLRVHLSQYDSAFTLRFDLFSSDGDLALTGDISASVRGMKQDGHGYSAEATISGNRVTVTGDRQMTAIAGDNLFEIVLTQNGEELSSANFILDIERATLDKDTLPSGSVIRELVNVIDRTDEILEAADTIDSKLSDLDALFEEVRSAKSDAEHAAENAVNDVQDELHNELLQMAAIKDYLDNYISDLAYGDEVSY